jgi:glycosyltransferase involved in cell wall biosynthesis
LSIENAKILINASRIGEVGGLYTFTEGLLRCFEDDPKTEVLLPEGVKINSSLPRVNVPSWLASSSRVSVFRPILWWLYSLSMFPATRKTRILCTTHHVVPFRMRQVVFVHDLRPYFYPDTALQKFNFRWLLPRALRKCDGVLTVSETSRKLIASIYNIDVSRIYVVPQVVNSGFFTEDTPVSIEEQYLLTVGSTWPHKNVEEILRMHRHWASKYRLIIVGGQGQYMESLKKIVASIGLQGRVSLLNDVSSEKLRSLFRGCTALIYPSIMEGFGIPPFEAMSCGKPVILSDIEVFHELHGDLPFYVRLGDESSWARAITALDSFDDERRQAGISHAQAYSISRFKTSLFSALINIWGEV